jgi:hypothetical protein
LRAVILSITNTKTTTWAQMAAMNILQLIPPSLTRTSSGSLAGISFHELSQDREVLIKMGDGKMIEQFQGKLPSELWKITNYA